MNKPQKRTFDRTLAAIKRQLKAMNCIDYEVGLFHRASDKMLPRFWKGEHIIKSIPWLKSMNSQGHDIFIRPKGSQGLIFFDDLSFFQIEKMKTDGYAPAVLIQSSPKNYHGWLRISSEPIDPKLATAICKMIAHRYGGDKDSADWRHYGRLAGMTNVKPKYIQSDGLQPFVLLSEANGKLAANASLLIDKAQEQLIKNEARKLAEKVRQKTTLKPKNLKVSGNYFLSQLRGLSIRYGEALDHSRADWMIVNQMIDIGYSEDQIRAALEEHSPALATRQNHIDLYIKITLENAYSK